MIKKNPLFILVPTVMLMLSCAKEKSPEINYLNQQPPGLVAQVFAPGVISTDAYEHSAPAFSPDGTVVLWTVVDKNYRGSIFEMAFQHGKWSRPYRPSFADSTADDYYPSFSQDGKRLYFSSRRNVPSGYPPTRDIRIWQVQRVGDKWEDAIPSDTIISTGQEYAHSVASSGTLFFSGNQGGRTNFDIWRAHAAHQGEPGFAKLPYTINSVGYEDGPYVSPDESFLIFESDRPEGIGGSIDLYIAFKDTDGSWSIPLNMGPKVNSPFSERFARVSPDGKYLFFGSRRSGNFDIYWIDAGIVQELRSSVPGNSKIDGALGGNIIKTLNENNFGDASKLLEQWLARHPNNLDAVLDYSVALRKLRRYSDAEQFLAAKAPNWSENANIKMEVALIKLALNKDDEASQLLSPVLLEGEQQLSRYMYLSSALLSMEKFEVSDHYFQKAMAINSNRFEYHRRAREYALIGQKDKAFENLNIAVELGHTSKIEFESDAELESLRSDSRFVELLSKLE